MPQKVKKNTAEGQRKSEVRPGKTWKDEAARHDTRPGLVKLEHGRLLAGPGPSLAQNYQIGFHGDLISGSGRSDGLSRFGVLAGHSHPIRANVWMRSNTALRNSGGWEIVHGIASGRLRQRARAARATMGPMGIAMLHCRPLLPAAAGRMTRASDVVHSAPGAVVIRARALLFCLFVSPSHLGSVGRASDGAENVFTEQKEAFGN